jgi:hypothetical protein
MLTQLDLSRNHIGSQGAQYLAEAFLQSKVNLILSFYPSFTSSISPIDTDYNRPQLQ